MFSKDSRHFFKFLNHTFYYFKQKHSSNCNNISKRRVYPFFEGIIGNKFKHTIYIIHKKHLFVKNILQIFNICGRVQACQNV